MILQKTQQTCLKIVEDYFIVLKRQNTSDLPKDLYGIFEGIKTPDKKP
jgi:hypothetical protein